MKYKRDNPNGITPKSQLITDGEVYTMFEGFRINKGIYFSREILPTNTHRQIFYSTRLYSLDKEDGLYIGFNTYFHKT